MSYQTDLDRIVAAKASMRESIIAKGVEVPESAELATYPQYISEIASSTDFEIPDLSQPLTKEGYDNLQNIVAAGKASEYLNLGDEILVPYGSDTMPFEVVGFDDVEIEGGDTVPAINLLAKYTDETGSEWGPSNNTKYSASILRTNITTTYQNKLDTNFVSCLAKSKVQTYSRDGSTDVVYDKLYAPSMENLGVTDTNYNTTTQATVEGPVLTVYQGSDNTKRIKQAVNATSTAQLYWSRSIYYGTANYFSLINTTGAADRDYRNASYRIVASCNFVGSTGGGNLPEPGVYDLANLKLALATDNPAEYFPIGQEVPDTYNGNSNPLIVAQYLDSTNNSSYDGAEGVILVRKYVEPSSQIWGTGQYGSSTVKEFLDSAYLQNCSESLKSLLSPLSVGWYNISTSKVDVASQKCFLMSAIEVGAAYHSGDGEGVFFEYWKEKTGLTAPSNSAMSGRIGHNINGSPTVYWIRTINGNSITDGGCITKTGAASYASGVGSKGVLPACFISKN